MSKNMERRTDLIYCNKCPEEQERFCIPYVGNTRLVFNPLPVPIGLRKYKEGIRRFESIEDCPFRQKLAGAS